MSESSWQENDSYNELEPLSTLLADLTPVSDTPENDLTSLGSVDRRRQKAALVLAAIWASTIALHLVAWGYWLMFGLTAIMGVHAIRILLTRSLPEPEALAVADPESVPFVSLLVAAKNEEAVIGRLVNLLCSLDYPASRYELWVIDDSSTDGTPQVLQQLAQQYSHLRVFNRPPGSTGGKSGALNQVLPLLQGEIIAVFDADAQVTPDLLRRVLPLFDRPQVGAVQVRKAIANASDNFWTYGQVAEMAMDSYFQQQRIAIGGIGELRGNGQFLRRTALERCGGWNEQTITDDLDLTIRLHLDQWEIDFLAFPFVEEEGVTRAISLWHQRNRWAEGGYQRYLDYWKPILRNRMGTQKTIDLFMFWITQYLLPTAAIPDFLMAILRNRPLLFTPVASLTVSLSLLGTILGLQQIRRKQKQLVFSDYATDGQKTASTGIHELSVLPPLRLLIQAILGTLYMLHWFPVVASTTLRMSIRPKRLKWVKTVHHGNADSGT
jgi:1,2-diacylglycerol 3-beta-glucosyltransferase